MPGSTVFDPFMLHLCQMFALRPSLKSLAITQAQIDQRYHTVLDTYVEKLIVFFTQPTTGGVSRWGRLAHLLEQKLRQASVSHKHARVRNMIRSVLYYPDSGLRDEQLDVLSPKVYLVERHGCQALAISRDNDKALVFTLARGVEVFDSVASLRQQTGLLLDASERLEHDVFEGWALGALEMAIQRIERVDLGQFPDLEQLDRQLAWASRFGDFLEPQVQQDKQRYELEEQLPPWLKNASPEGRLAYSLCLERMAVTHKRFKGTSFLDNLPPEKALLNDVQTDEGAECRQRVADQLVVHLRRLALECALQGVGGVTFDGYRILYAATQFFIPHRQLNDVPMVFRPLKDESGYLVGPPAGQPGPWVVVRLWSQPVMQQTQVELATGAALTAPVTALYLACIERWLPLAEPKATQYGAGWTRSQLMLPVLEHPLQTVARLGQIGGNLQGNCETEPDWRCEVSLLRNVALLLVCPGTLQPDEVHAARPRVKRLDSAWAGARQVLSVKQQDQLRSLRRTSPTLAERVTSGIHKGLNRLRNGTNTLLETVIYNKDENHFNVLSNNQLVISFNPIVEHQLVDNPHQPVHYGPYIAPDADDQWHIQRAPRLKRDSPAALQAMERGNALGLTFSTLLSDAERQSRMPGTLAVEVEERLERSATAFDGAASAIRNARGNAALASQLQAQALQLRAKGRALRIEMTRQSQTPTVGDVQYLLEQQVIRIHRLEGRVTETIEGKTDYLQEYEVQDLSAGNKPLWYAHFHYASLQAADQQPTAAHLKTAAQRRLGREYENKTGQRVYRGPLANAAARQIFLGSPVA